jgi:HEAT repeat protein
MRTPEVLELSLRLAASADPARRRDGFDLLQTFTADTPAARELIELALQTEQDPAVLSSAVMALGASVVGPEENARVVEQLRRLAEHEDPGVRGHSLSQLAQWNRSPDVEAQLYKALADEAQSVREIATLAVAEAGVRTDRLRNALLGIVDNDAESSAVRASALQALVRFPLSSDEYARYLAARAEVGLFGEDTGEDGEQ